LAPSLALLVVNLTAGAADSLHRLSDAES